jgi:hypothetical protein
MATTYTHFSDLAKEVQPPDKGILSRTLFSDDRLKAVPSASPKARSFPNTPPQCPPSCTSSRVRPN